MKSADAARPADIRNARATLVGAFREGFKVGQNRDLRHDGRDALGPIPQLKGEQIGHRALWIGFANLRDIGERGEGGCQGDRFQKSNSLHQGCLRNNKVSNERPPFHVITVPLSI
jgi:hypothetical protein